MAVNRKIFIIVCLAVTVRLIFLFSYINPQTTNFWEYGDIAKNMHQGKGYSLFYFENDSLKLNNSFSSTPLPSAYMPPLYVYFIYPFMAFESKTASIITIFSVQILISAVTIILFFAFVSKLFNEKTALISAVIFAFYPEFIYADNSIGTSSLFFLFLILLLFRLFDLLKSDNAKINNIIFAGIISGLIVLLRSEMFFLIAVFLLILLFQKKIKTSVMILSLIIIIISPWIIRNYFVFEKFVPFTTNAGQNLYRGNNHYRPGVWMDESIRKELSSLPRDMSFEIEMNKLFLRKSTDYIFSHPGDAGLNFLKKISHLLFYNPYDQRTSHPLYFVPWILLVISSIIGILLNRGRKTLVLIIYLLFYLLLAGVFFALPRYQTMFKIALLPYSAFFINYLTEKKSH